MGLFHKCKWKEVSRTFNPPSEARHIKNVYDLDWLERMINGFTVIELKCETCGDIGFRRVAGRTNSNLEQV